jgi:hypothetical protein
VAFKGAIDQDCPDAVFSVARAGITPPSCSGVVRRFSFEDMLDLRGNTAVYMLYAHARIASIIRKAGKDVAELAATAHISLDHPCEARSRPPYNVSHVLPALSLSTAPVQAWPCCLCMP